MSKKRVLIIGLDGGTFNIIKPMIEAGRLPVIGKLMAKGSSGELRSTVLPVTPPAWASFMTGKNPGKHGVYGFYAYSNGTYNTSMVSGLSIRSKKIWNYFDRERIGLIDVPMTYPPESINGYMISGWPVPSDESIFTFPPELHTEMISKIGEYMIDRTLSERANNNFINTLRDLYRYTEMRKDAALYLLEKKGPFDFFMVVFRGTDFIQHEAFKFHDDRYCRANLDMARKFKDVIFQFYEKMDSIVEKLIEAMGDNSVTIIMSDHGAGPMEKKFYINRWLMKEGFLSLKRGASPNGISVGRKPLSEVLHRIGGSYFNFFIPSILKHKRIPYLKPYRKHPSALIDWERTKAFANFTWTDGVLRINLKGREPTGIVEQKDYGKVRNEIVEKLKALKDPETGRPVVQYVHKREEVYHGQYLEDAPDLLILTDNTSYLFSSVLDGGPILERPENPAPAPHRMEGIFISNGPDIETGRNIADLDITDIAPTVFYLMGKRIPESMDGKVIKEAIKEEYFRRNPPVYYKEEESESAIEGARKFSIEEEEKITEGLKALGYME